MATSQYQLLDLMPDPLVGNENPCNKQSGKLGIFQEAECLFKIVLTRSQ